MIIEEFVSTLGLDIDDSGLEKFRLGIINTTAKIAGLIGVTLGAASAISSLLNAVAETNEAAKFARAIDISFESLERLEFAAGRVNIGAGTLRSTLQGLRTAAQGAFTGFDQGAASSFALLGVDITDLNGKLRTADQLLLAIAETVATAENEAFALTIAQQLGLGPDLNLLLDLGADGIRRLGDEAARTGAILDHDAAVAAEKFTEQTDALGRSMRVLLVEAGGPFVDWLIKIVELFREFSESSEGRGLGSGLEAVVIAVGELVSAPFELLGKLSKFLESVGLSTRAQAILATGTALAVLASGFGILGASITAFLLVADDLVAFLNDQPSVIGDLTELFGKSAESGRLSSFDKFLEAAQRDLGQGLFHLTSGFFRPATETSAASIRGFSVGSPLAPTTVQVTNENHFHGATDAEQAARRIGEVTTDVVEQARQSLATGVLR